MDESQRKIRLDQPSSLIYPRKFDTAIRKSTLIEFQQRLDTDTLTFDDNLLWIEADPDIPCSTLKVDPQLNLCGLILSDLILRKDSLSVNGTWLQRAVELAAKNFTMQTGILEQGVEPGLQPLFGPLRDHVSKTFQTDPLLSTLAAFAHDLTEVIERLGSNPPITRRRDLTAEQKTELVRKVNHWSSKTFPLKVRWAGRLAKIHWNNQSYIVPRAYILQVHNKVCDALSVLVNAKISDGWTLQKGSYIITQRFFSELIGMSLEYRDDYYTVAKCLEGLIAAETLGECDNWENTEFLSAICADMYQATGFQYRGSYLRACIRRAEAPLRHELGCMGKMVGHPYVDMELGIRKLKEATCMKLDIDQDYLLDTIRHCKKEFIRGYIMKHRKWPLVHWVGNPALVPRALLRSCLMNLDPDSQEVRVRYGKCTLASYDYLELGKVMEFNPLENAIPYLKDKTISTLRSKTWDWYIRRKEGSKPPQWTETRQLLHYLLSSDEIFDHQKYLKLYTYSKDLTMLLDYLVIRIVPKEKELKVDFRGFGCKTFEDRLRGTTQEVNVKHFLDLYSDEQVMTLSELEVCRKLNAWRNITKAYKGYRALYINIDASKWNNRFRDALVRPVMAATLDRIFDTPIFSRTHEAFQNTLFYVPDESGTEYWEGQEGGIEGLHQDTWVTVYISMIKATLRDETYKYHILCKGDDLRVVILIPPQESVSMETIRQRVVTKISERAALLGHKIKVEDSYGSENYFCFSKAASIGRVEMPSTYRKVQKTYGANNAFLPFLDDLIGSAYSNAHSTSRVSVCPVAPYLVGLTWVYYHLVTQDYYKDCTDDELLGLSLIPSVLGGFPTIYYHNMAVRAESDLLSPFLEILGYCQVYHRRVYRVMRNFLLVQYDRHRDYFPGLLADSYSLAITKPNLPTTIYRQAIRPIIKDKTTNPIVAKLLDMEDTKAMRNLIAELKTANPYNARVLSAINAAAPTGLVMELTRKFDSARSIFELVVATLKIGKAEKLLRRVIRAERYLQLWRLRVIRGEHRWNRNLTSVHSECPAQFANNIREATWGRAIQSITMPPMMHQIHLTTPELSCRDTWSTLNAFTYEVEPALEVVGTSSFAYTAGGRLPFLGFTTRTGTTTPTVSFVEKDIILTRVKNLLELADWVDVSGPDVDDPTKVVVSNLPDLIMKVVQLYIDVDISKIAPFAGKHKSGTIQHHIRAPKFRESIVPNVLSNAYTRIKGESNTHLRLNDSRQHYTLNFLHVYCYVTSLLTTINLGARGARVPTRYWGVTTRCDYCNTPISENPIMISGAYLPAINFHPIQATRLPTQSRKILIESLERFRPEDLVIPESLEYITEEFACLAIIQELIDNATRHRQRLQDKYTQHTMTAEAGSILQALAIKNQPRDIGMSEVVRIPSLYLVQAVSTIIVQMMLRADALADETSVGRMMASMPSSELPWTPLFRVLHKNLRMHDCITRLVTELHLPMPRCADSPNTAAALCATLSFRYFIQLAKPVTVIRLTKYINEDMVRLVIGLPRVVLLRHLHLHYIRTGLVRTDVDDLHLQLRTLFVLCHATEKIPEDIADEIVLKREEAVFEICVVDWDETYLETLDTLLDDPDSLHPRFSNLMRRNPSLPWEDALEDFSDTCFAESEHYRLVCQSLTIRVVLAELHTCIQKVRNLPPVQESTRNPDIAYDVTQLEIEPIVPEQYLLFTLGPQTLEVTQSSPDLPRTTPTDPPIKCYPYNSFRPFTMGNTSCSRLVWVLSHLVPLEALQRSLCTLHLADGHGGFTAVIASCSLRSHLIFSSLTRDLEHPPDAPYARQFIEARGHTLNTRLAASGLGDLTSEASVTATVGICNELRAQGHGVSLVTCDADFLGSWSSDEDILGYVGIVRNAARIFLEVSDGRTIFICKVLIYDLRPLSAVIATLGADCGFLQVWRNPASAWCSFEVYIIASGGCAVRTSSIITYLAESWVSVLSLISKVAQLRRDSDLRTINFPVVGLWAPSVLQYWRNHLPLTVVARVFDEHHLNITFVVRDCLDASLEVLFGGTDSPLRTLQRMFNQQARFYLDSIDNIDGPRLFMRHVDLQTRAHVVILSQKSLQCYGAVDMITHIFATAARHRSYRHVNSQQVWGLYRRRIMAEAVSYGRLQWTEDGAWHSERNPSRPHPLDRPYMHYLFGVRYILYLLSAWSGADAGI